MAALRRGVWRRWWWLEKPKTRVQTVLWRGVRDRCMFVEWKCDDGFLLMSLMMMGRRRGYVCFDKMKVGKRGGKTESSEFVAARRWMSM
jgi:hypothetical protein